MQSRFALAAVLAASFAIPVHALPPEELEQRLLILERQIEIQQEESDSKAKDSTAASASDRGFSLKKGDFELRFRALVQADGRFFVTDDAPKLNDNFLLRRVRPTLEGTLGKWVSFRLTPELAGASTTVLDAYVDLAVHPSIKVRAGRFKTPVGLERYFYSTAALNHVEFGLPTALVPTRDFGLQVHGDALNGTLNYAVAYTNGAADGQDAPASDGDNRKEIAIRLFAEPFKNGPGFFQGLGFGLGATQGSKLGSAANTLLQPGYNTPGQQRFFAYDATVFANGEVQRLTPQAYFYRNNFSALAEYVSAQQELSEAAVNAEVENTAWQLSTTWVITGEDASLKGIKPSSPYAPGADGWGAFELAARIGELEVDDAALAQGFVTPGAGVQKEARTYGLGLNWSLTNNIKWAINYDHTRFKAFTGAERESETAVFTRLQLVY